MPTIVIGSRSLNIMGGDGDVLTVANIIDGLNHTKALRDIEEVDIEGFSSMNEQALRAKIAAGQPSRHKDHLALAHSS